MVLYILCTMSPGPELSIGNWTDAKTICFLRVCLFLDMKCISGVTYWNPQKFLWSSSASYNLLEKTRECNISLVELVTWTTRTIRRPCWLQAKLPNVFSGRDFVNCCQLLCPLLLLLEFVCGQLSATMALLNFSANTFNLNFISFNRNAMGLTKSCC